MQPERKVVQRGAAPPPPPPPPARPVGWFLRRGLFPGPSARPRSWRFRTPPARDPGGPLAGGEPHSRRGERRRRGPILCWSGEAEGYGPLGGKAVTLQFYAHAAGSLRPGLTPTAPGRPLGRHVGSPPLPRPGPATASLAARVVKRGLQPLSNPVSFEFSVLETPATPLPWPGAVFPGRGMEEEPGDWPLLCILGTGVRKWRK